MGSTTTPMTSMAMLLMCPTLELLLPLWPMLLPTQWSALWLTLWLWLTLLLMQWLPLLFALDWLDMEWLDMASLDIEESQQLVKIPYIHDSESYLWFIYDMREIK